jgi:hypothetical protein
MAENGQAPQVATTPAATQPPRRVTDDDIMRRINAIAEVMRSVGQHCEEQGERDARDCETFAAELLVQARKRLGALVAHRRQAVVDLERLVGSLGDGGA